VAGGYVSFKGVACGLLFNRAEWAGVVRRHESKRAMLGMANAWLTLAEQHLKNCETVLVYEKPPLVDERRVQWNVFTTLRRRGVSGRQMYMASPCLAVIG
jgi:hypothetical protein